MLPEARGLRFAVIRRTVKTGSVFLIAAALLHGCGAHSDGNSLGGTADFDVHWPLAAPGAAQKPKGKRLLWGRLNVRPVGIGTAEARLILSVTLTRPDDEEHRKLWNNYGAFYRYRWMGQVRVWDARRKWLWPNLAYLFRLHGLDRRERYGGWDPGKDVDNDFAAVLIRKYDPEGNEHPDTKGDRALVSAEWHSVGVEKADRQTLAHAARSDEFAVHLDGPAEAGAGRLTVWLMYADFMGEAAPPGWPAEKEFAGGTLAQYDVTGTHGPAKPFTMAVTRVSPPVQTGFDWPSWVGRDEPAMEPIGQARLTDR